MTRPMSDDGTIAVLIHVLMNEFGVIGAAARTLGERGDALPAAMRSQLLVMIDEAVQTGMDNLRVLMHASHH